VSFFYEIRSADNTVLKRDGGFASQDTAKTAAGKTVNKIKKMRQPYWVDVGTNLIRQNAERPTR